MHTPIAIAALACCAAAQSLSGTITTTGPYGNYVRQGSTVQFEAWPANKSIQAGLTEVVGPRKSSYAALTDVRWRVQPGPVLMMTVSEQGTRVASAAAGSTSSASASNVVQGPHKLLLTIRAPGGTKGRLESWIDGLAFTGSSVLHELDVGNDKSIDFRFTAGIQNVYVRKEWIITIPPSGMFPIAVSTDTKVPASPQDTVWATSFNVRFTPGSYCRFQSYGTSCGPVLTGLETINGPTRRITLWTTQATPSAIGAIAVGTPRIALPIPGTRCWLSTIPAVMLPAIIDPRGVSVLTLSLPRSINVLANFQLFALSNTAITSSHGLAADCR